MTETSTSSTSNTSNTSNTGHWTAMEFYRLVELYQAWGQRKGQAMFNALNNLDPFLADNFIRGKFKFDCFYDDKKIPAFIQEVFGETYRGA